MNTPSPSPSHDWRSIAVLNAVSAFAQIGQFGIPFVVLPIWLEQQGADAFQLSLFSSSLWLGQLPGLGFAPRLSRRFGAKRVVWLSLASTALGLGAMLPGIPALWWLSGVLAGFGQGLRWNGLESWLYAIAPDHARGRLVGFHETLIALAPIVAPLMSARLGLDGPAPLWLGIGFLLVSAASLQSADGGSRALAGADSDGSTTGPLRLLPREGIFLLGVGVAFFGGMSESAIIGLFPLFAKSHQLDAQQTAGLLTSFGVGGLLLQYVAGWLADHRGMAFASLCCAVGTALVSLALCFELNPLWLHGAVFCLGGLVTAYLTLALIASAKTQAGSLAHNMAAVAMTYTLSAVAGPVIANRAIVAFGGNGLMYAVAGLAVLMAICIAATAVRRR
jgi:MFS family permease